MGIWITRLRIKLISSETSGLPGTTHLHKAFSLWPCWDKHSEGQRTRQWSECFLVLFFFNKIPISFEFLVFDSIANFYPGWSLLLQWIHTFFHLYLVPFFWNILNHLDYSLSPSCCSQGFRNLDYLIIFLIFMKHFLKIRIPFLLLSHAVN